MCVIRSVVEELGKLHAAHLMRVSRAARPTMPTSFHQSLSMMELKRGSSPPAMLDLRTSTRASVSSLFWERRSRVTACSLGVEPRLHKTFIFFMMFKMLLVQQAIGMSYKIGLTQTFIRVYPGVCKPKQDLKDQ